MNALAIQSDLELAAFQFAEAERHERMAKKLRYEGMRLTAAVAAEMKAAIEKAQQIKTPKP